MDKHIENTNETQVLEGGNTRETPSRNWTFTYNNYNSDTIDTLVSYFEMNNKNKYIFQEETGNKGTNHLQGYIHFENARKFKQLFKIDKNIHWEKCKSILACINYCKKLDTRTGKVYTNMNIKIENKGCITTFKPFQQRIIDIISTKPHPRIIHWFWEKNGNVGKTMICKHICLTNKNAIYVSGATKDINYAITKMKEAPKIILWDIPRSSIGFINYGCMEKIKDGMIFSTKYESKMLIFDSPHIICFANEEPDKDELSKDKWNIVEIKDST